MACDDCVALATKLEAEGYEYRRRNEDRQRKGIHDTFYPDRASACFQRADLIRNGCVGSGPNHVRRERASPRSTSTAAPREAQGEATTKSARLSGCIAWIIVIVLVAKFCGD
jgi:hypothetical protein